MENILCTTFSLRYFIMTKNRISKIIKIESKIIKTCLQTAWVIRKTITPALRQWDIFCHCFSRGNQEWRAARQNGREKEQANFQLHIQLCIHQKPRHYTEYTSTPWRNNGSCLLTFSKRVLEGSQILHLSDW